MERFTTSLPASPLGQDELKTATTTTPRSSVVLPHPSLAGIFETSGEEMDCTKELLDALRQLTGEFLTFQESKERDAYKYGALKIPTEQILACWETVLIELDELTSPLRAIRLQYHLESNRLTTYEVSALRAAWRKLKRQGTIPKGVVTDEPLLGYDDQKYWYERGGVLRLHLRNERAALLERLQELNLYWSDVPALRDAWEAVKKSQLTHRQITALRLRPHFTQAIPSHLREDFKIAVQHNSFPTYLHEALAEAAQALNLELQTLAPPELPSGGRETLLRGWRYVVPLLGDDTLQLWSALEAGRYTLAQAEQLKQLLDMPLPKTLVPEEDRKYLLQRTCWKKIYPRPDYIYLRISLEARSYTLRFMNMLDGLVKGVKDLERREEEKAAQKAAQAQAERQRQIIKAQREEQKRIEQAAQRLHERLLTRWRVFKPRHVELLQRISFTDLLRDLPFVCQEFQNNKSSISLAIEEAVCSYLERPKATV